MAEEYSKHLPTELESKILQYVADGDESDRSLFNCALVCKAWAEHAQRLLYYAINMHNSRGREKLHRLGQYPYLRPFVRHVKWPRPRKDGEVHRFDADVIKDVAPWVMKLSFREVYYHALERSLREDISAFTNVQELDMTGSELENWTT